jgi:hypothetical protein
MFLINYDDIVGKQVFLKLDFKPAVFNPWQLFEYRFDAFAAPPKNSRFSVLILPSFIRRAFLIEVQRTFNSFSHQ